MTKRIQRFHTYFGLFLSLPLITWAITGAFFYFKPNYQNAFHQLAVKTYPLTHDSISIATETHWKEIKLVKTVLGEHLIVLTDQGFENLKLDDLSSYTPLPKNDAIRLIKDAITSKPERYGLVTEYNDGVAVTSTGVKIELNETNLTLRQSGADTRFINTLYKIHYLEWLGFKTGNRIFGMIGLVSLLILTGLGLISYLKRRKPPSK